jgi:hypothetical protein
VLEQINEFLPKEYLWVISPVVIGIFVLRGVLSFAMLADKRLTGRIESMKNALASDLIRGRSREFIEELLEYNLFYKATGIDCDVKTREAIIEMKGRTASTLSTSIYKHAIEYIKFSDELRIKVPKHEIVWFVLLITSSILLFFLSVLEFILVLINLLSSRYESIYEPLILSMALFITSLLMNMLGMNIVAAIKLKIEMKNLSGCARKIDRVISVILDAIPPYNALNK